MNPIEQILDIDKYFFLHDGLAQNRFYIWSLLLLNGHHQLDDISQWLRICAFNGWVRPFKNLDGQSLKTLGVKCCSKTTYFIEDASQGPNIRFIAIRLILKQLRSHVVRCTDTGVGQLFCLVQHFGYAEITQLDSFVFEKKILGFHVSM